MTLLEQANQAFRNQQYEVAIARYVHVLQQLPTLSHLLLGNLQRAQKRYRQSRRTARSKVCVSGWNLAGNAAGRVATLAQIWAGFTQVEIIGCLFPAKDSEIWSPIRNLPIPIHPLLVEYEQTFVQRAIEYVLQHPCDLLHLSKPRFPNILLGLLYKLIWDCPVLMDIDDEELAFVRAIEAIALPDYLQAHDDLPNIIDLIGKTYTQIAVGLATAFDEVTVVNSALQQRYGGTIVHHARDEATFRPSTQRRNQSRAKLNIPAEYKVILFFGTPRAHKGLLETAQAIAQQKRDDLLFLIVGDFPPKLQALKEQIETMPGLRSCLLGNQPFEAIPDILAAGDICVLLQDADNLAAQYQTPAKLTDALAMGLIVLATPTPALADLATQGAFISILPGQLPEILATALAQLPLANPSPEAHPIFTRHLTLAANQSTLTELLNKHKGVTSCPLDARLKQLAEMHKPLKVFTGKRENFVARQNTESRPFDKYRQKKIAIVVHYFYPEIWQEIKLKLVALPKIFDLFVTVPFEITTTAKKDILPTFPAARFHTTPNIGMDVLPFLSLIPKLAVEGYYAVCKIHTKKGRRDDLDTIWRQTLLDSLIGSERNLTQVLDAFLTHADLCMIGPAALYQSGKKLMYDNAANITKILNKAYGQDMPREDWGFFAGTMFWSRIDILLKLANEITPESHRTTLTNKQRDGKYEHAMERVFGLLPRLHYGRVGLLHPENGSYAHSKLTINDADTVCGQSHITGVLQQLAKIRAGKNNGMIDSEEPPFLKYIKLNEALIDWQVLASRKTEPLLVSIIIPIYNQLQLTQVCIESIIRAKTEIAFEIICVDNGSESDIADYINVLCKENRQIRYIRNSENYNFALGCNLGFQASRGAITVFLNNDTTVTNNWLEALIQPLQEDKVVAVQPKLLYPDQTIQNVGVVFAQGQPFGYPIYANFSTQEPCVNISRDYQAITAACMAIRANDFAKAKGFDPLFINGMEDVDLCLRLTHGTGRVCRYQASSIVIHHESKTPGRGRYVNLNRKNFAERWKGKIEPDDFQYYQADKLAVRSWKFDSAERMKTGLGLSRPILEKVY